MVVGFIDLKFRLLKLISALGDGINSSSAQCYMIVPLLV